MEQEKAQGATPQQNERMAWLLRSPHHNKVSDRILLLSFTGCKSGKVYSTPVSYMQEADNIIVFTDSPWWKNLLGGAKVGLVLRGEEKEAYAVPVIDPQEVADGLRRLAHKDADDTKYFGVTLDADGQPNEAQLVRAAEENVMLRIQPL